MDKRRMLADPLKQIEAAMAGSDRHIGRHHDIIGALEPDGHDATTAKDLLYVFVDVKAAYEAHRDRIRGESTS